MSAPGTPPPAAEGATTSRRGRSPTQAPARRPPRARPGQMLGTASICLLTRLQLQLQLQPPSSSYYFVLRLPVLARLRPGPRAPYLCPYALFICARERTRRNVVLEVLFPCRERQLDRRARIQRRQVAPALQSLARGVQVWTNDARTSSGTSNCFARRPCIQCVNTPSGAFSPRRQPS